MIENKTSFALLVHSCDRYELLYKGFEFFFNKFWDFSIPMKYYFATEEKDVIIKNFKTIKSGKGQWSDRLMYLLKEKIKEDYVLYFQEDMWLCKPISGSFFETLFNVVKNHNWKIVKLHDREDYVATAQKLKIAGFSSFLIDASRSKYLMSHQVTLWEKSTLIDQLNQNEHPWRNERNATKRLRKKNIPIVLVRYFFERSCSKQCENFLLAGEYESVSVNGLLDNNSTIFIKELQQEEREYSNLLLNHFTNRLTHDGLSRPRKEDI